MSADSASSQINELIFDGLIDLDSNLNYRPRLAKDWTEYEEAYLALNFDFELNGKKLKNGYLWKKFILDELKKNVRWFKNIEKIEILYGEEKLEELLVKSKKIGIPDSKIHYIVNIPDRIKFTLQKVDQDFFKPIFEVLGESYKTNFPYLKFAKFENKDQQYFTKKRLKNILQVAEHNPVIVFKLRQGIKFHDGKELDANDVIFTYEAIMNPENISPRRSDYEPIKEAKVLGKHEIKFVYKRLFSSALNSWTMGILPEHLLNKKALQKEFFKKSIVNGKIKKISIPINK